MKARQFEVGTGAPLLEVAVHDDIPNTAASAGILVALTALGLRIERANRVRTVVEELVVESRAREPFPDADSAASLIRIRMDILGHNIRVMVTDFRMPVQGAMTHRLPSRRLASLGFVDSVHIANRGRDGNVSVCSISMDDDHGSLLDGVEVLPNDVPSATHEAASSVTIRVMTSGDVPGLIRCIYRCYGYSYPDDLVYKPVVLRRLLRTGLMHSVVALDVSGEVVGHCSLSFAHPSDRVPEAGRLVVDPRYRGHQLAQRLGAARNDVARSLGLPGLWSECVTNHVASQRNLLTFGGIETGLLIGAGPSDVVMSGLSNTNDGRRTLLPFFVPLDVGQSTVNYVARRHVDTFEMLARRIGIDRQLIAEIEVPDGTTRLTADVNLVAGVAYLRIETIGGDLVSAVAEELDSLVGYELGAVHIDVQLADPHAGYAAEMLERHGFCWGAWLPGELPDSDVLRLQRVGEHLADVTHVQCARDEGGQLRDWVVEEWHRVRRGYPQISTAGSSRV